MELSSTINEELKQQIVCKQIRNADLSEINLSEIDFSECKLENVDFSKNKTLRFVSFKTSVLINCRFRDCELNSCDFRYAHVADTTFEKAVIRHSDFYRTAFQGITIFQDAQLEMCSLNYLSFETFCITKDNLSPVKNTQRNSLFEGKIAHLIQEHEKEFEGLLTKWKGVDSLGKTTDFKYKMNCRYAEAERIYRQLSALWESKGYNKDSEWAYVQAKRAERLKL